MQIEIIAIDNRVVEVITTIGYYLLVNSLLVVVHNEA